MIPTTLDGWTLEIVRSLVVQGVFETDRFDFKEVLPHAKDDDGKRRLRRDVAAFANSGGGFLVVGVKDAKGLTPEERVVGVPASYDFPEHFGSYPSASEPSIDWTFKNSPPIALEPDRIIHVVQIPRSARRPHGVFEEHRWWFCKRTNKGTESMSHAELRDAFAQTRETLAKLRLLIAEVESIRATAWEINIRAAHARAGWQGLIPAYDDSLVRSLLPDVAHLIDRDPQLLQYIPPLREAVRVAEDLRTAPWVVNGNRANARLVAFNLGRAAQRILQAADLVLSRLKPAIAAAER